MAFTHGHGHAVVLFVGAAASEEADDEDDAANNYEYNGYRAQAAPKKVKVGFEPGLHHGPCDDKPQSCQL